MSRLFSALLVCLGMIGAGNAMAGTCGEPGSPKAKILDLPHSEENARTAMAAAIAMGLSPYTFPMDKIAKISTPCKRLNFKAGDDVYTLYGSYLQGSGPPRYAMRGDDRSRIAYLALLPLPKPALAAMRAGSKDGQYRFKQPDMIFVLAVTDGYQRPFFRFYGAIPDDQTLAIDMCAALTGEDNPIGAYNSSFGNTEFYAAALPKPARPKCRMTIS